MNQPGISWFMNHTLYFKDLWFFLGDEALLNLHLAGRGVSVGNPWASPTNLAMDS